PLRPIFCDDFDASLTRPSVLSRVWILVNKHVLDGRGRQAELVGLDPIDHDGRSLCTLCRRRKKIGDQRQNVPPLCPQITKELIIKSRGFSIILWRERF